MTRPATLTTLFLTCALFCAAPAMARELDDLRDDDAPSAARRVRARDPEPTWAWELVMGFALVQNKHAHATLDSCKLLASLLLDSPVLNDSHHSYLVFKLPIG
jgi:hypothetical protein